MTEPTSEAYREYFRRLQERTDRAYAIAEEARSRGLDPAMEPEIPPARDLAERVENLVGPEGVAARIRELSEEMDRESLSLQIAREVAQGAFGEYDQVEDALDAAVRAGLAILTEGVLVAPLEGIAEVRLLANDDGSRCAALVFAGPIRSAGGTGEALSVLIADVVRRELGLERYEATHAEVERYKEEIPAYKRAVNLQYTPDADEIETIVQGCPVAIDGEGTSDQEVSGYRDLPRVETNRLRGGACLVVAEGVAQKVPKLKKHVDRLEIDGWGFLEDLYSRKAGDDADDEDASPEASSLSDTYLGDLVAGRPVLAHPSRPGGFRLRYGRSRTAGLAATSIHPAVMVLVDDFLAVGTQMKIAGPGKATIATPCDAVLGPTVVLDDGRMVRVETAEQAREIRDRVEAIVDLGEMLVPYGEFLENNKPLLAPSWVPEWWAAEVEAAGHEPKDLASAADAFAFAEATGTPLHPDWTLLWHDLDLDGLDDLREAAADGRVDDGTLHLPAAVKDHLVDLNCLHRQEDDELHVDEPLALLRPLGLDVEEGRIVERAGVPEATSVMEAVTQMAGVLVRPRAPTRIGARIGRPEKAAERKMQPPVHVLFPVGSAGGMQRLVKDAAKAGTTDVEVGRRRCVDCGETTPRVTCDCGGHTEPLTRCPDCDKRVAGEACPTCGAETWSLTDVEEVPVAAYLDEAKQRVGASRIPDVKGVKGTMSAHNTPEPLEKGILRAQHGVWVFKDGTIRYDMTDVPLTHFKPREIGLTVAKARDLGYTEDVDGEPLEEPDQVVELKVQDLVLSEDCGRYLLQAADYVDDLLVRYYHLDRHYEADDLDDLIGHLVVGLAPHTSGGVLGRIVGFADVQGGYAHPYFHAAKRRNCLHPESDVFVLNSPEVSRRRLADLYDQAPGPGEVVDDIGTRAREVEGLRVLSTDPATGRVEPRPVRRVYRTPAPRHLVRIETASGRSFTCSPRHRVEMIGDDGLTKARAGELAAGDRLAFAGRVELPETDAGPLDLLAEMADDPPEDLMVRGLEGTLQGLIDDLGGLKRAAEAAGTRMKALDNYRRRDSVPWTLLADLLGATGRDLDDIPRDVRLAVKRDTVEIPRILEWSPALMRLVGYYLAEGYARREPGSFHQVCLAAGEEPLRDDIRSSCREVLGLEPSTDKHVLSIAGRLVHHLFTEILDLGTDARSKRIPARLASLPRELTREMVAAYFAGDGSVEKGRLHVVCHSVNRRLLRDVGLQLAARGIAYRIRTEERRGGGVVRAFYEDQGKEVPTFTSHHLSIRSEHAVAFLEEIGFTLDRKQQALEAAAPKVRSDRFAEAPGDLIGDPVTAVETVEADTEWLYDLEVDDHHNFLVNDLTLTSNCDGDEDCVMLLMDGLLNFSRTYLPATRGGLMDAPLVLTTRIDPTEIDKEAHNVDTGSSYPLALYEAAADGLHPKGIAEQIDIAGGRLGTPAQFEGFGYTHATSDIGRAPPMSAYKTLGSMVEKMEAQLDVGDRTRPVDVADVASKVITTHFLPDLIGNLKAFSRQTVRCAKCNSKYRRVPLDGRCRNCGNELTMTVHEASVTKYLEIAKEVAETYDVDRYTYQRIEMVEQACESMFENDKVTEAKLEDFF